MNYFTNYFKITVMKKKIILMFAVIAFAGALAFNSITNSNKAALSAVTLANIEALTQGEIGIGLCTVDPNEQMCRHICGADYGDYIAGC